jgi:hypothetical protein
MDHPDKRTYFDTTDEFYFGQDAEKDLITINFGPIRIPLSNYAAHDLAYRLSAYLLYLDGGAGDLPAPKDSESLARPDIVLPDNVLMYPGRKKNEQ